MYDGSCSGDKLCGVIATIVCFDSVSGGTGALVSTSSVRLCEDVCVCGLVGGSVVICSYISVLLSMILLHTLSAVLLCSLYLLFM